MLPNTSLTEPKFRRSARQMGRRQRFIAAAVFIGIAVAFVAHDLVVHPPVSAVAWLLLVLGALVTNGLFFALIASVPFGTRRLPLSKTVLLSVVLGLVVFGLAGIGLRGHPVSGILNALCAGLSLGVAALFGLGAWRADNALRKTKTMGGQ